MEFGVPKEVRDLEMRVGLTPAGVLALTRAGHIVYVERGAGAGAGFSDENYRQAGAQIVYSAEEAYGRADVVVKVTRPTAQEHELFRIRQIIFSFLHLSVASPDLLEALVEREVTAIAYEMIQEKDGLRPVLLPMSEVAGRLTPVIAGQLLMSTHLHLQTPKGDLRMGQSRSPLGDGRGRGILLSGIPGVPPAAIVIIGGGVLGSNAARAFVGMGAQVTILDRDVKKLQYLDDMFGGRITTMISNEYNLNRVVEFADVLLGCVLTPGRRAPILVSRDMVRHMRPGSVIIDFSIDQGGCVETSRPTTLRDQTFVEEGIIHHCVPNMTATVARTASYALTNAALPYLLSVGASGLPTAFKDEPGLLEGVNLYRGKLAHPEVAAGLGRQVEFDLSLGVPE
jgi:alanine dehydrogenase